MDRPVIGLCTALERARWSVWDQQAFLLPRSYIDAVQRAGGIAVMLPPDERAIDEPDVLLDLPDGSLAARAAGETTHGTKSHHHQGVDRLGEGVEVTGWSTLDELPEAIELPGSRFALGVQWHPEADETSRLIGALVAEAAAAKA